MQVTALAQVFPAGRYTALPAVPAANVSSLDARREFAKLEQWMFSEETLGRPLHEVEAEQMRRSREVNRLLFQAHIAARGTGEVGPAVEVVSEEGSAIHSHRRLHTCHQQTVFGEVSVTRTGYGRPGAESVHPLDGVVQLPLRSFSYEMQRLVVKGAVRGPFHEATDTIQEFTGVVVPKRSAEQMVVEAAVDFDAFYRQRQGPPVEGTGPILVAAVDGKGIPMVKPEGAEPVVRRKKGEKANKKRMATVAAVFTQQARVRTPEEVADSLFHTPLKVVGPEQRDAEKRLRPEHKRIWASLEKGKEKTFEDVRDEMERRDPQGTKKRVVLTDGERALQKLALKVLTGILLILDLLHVLEKLWKVAHVFYEEGSQEAQTWVKDHALRILQGGVSQVVKGIRQSATKRGLKGNDRKTIDQVTNYLYRNRAYMRYDQYLAQGLPIASGAVEGACKNLIKDRMERSGMRWTPEMAEAMVKLRAIYLSGDFDDYWDFHVAQDQHRLYPANRWRPMLGVVEK